MTASATGAFAHDAFLYDSDELYVATLAPLLTDAVDGGDAVLAVLSGGNIELLRGALSDAAGVEFVPAPDWYVRPVSSIERYVDRLCNLPVGGRAFVIGEVEFGTQAAEWTDWTRYEAVLNNALSRYDAHIVCPYDQRRLPASVLSDAECTHPHLINPDRRTSDRYQSPRQFLATLPPIVTTPQRPADLTLELPEPLADIRRTFRRAATTVGLDAERVDELTFAVNEIVTDTAVHGRGTGSLQLWADTRELICLIRDDDSECDPLISFERPSIGSQSGFGLWLAHQFFDLTDIRPVGTGTEISLAAWAGPTGEVGRTTTHVGLVRE